MKLTITKINWVQEQKKYEITLSNNQVLQIFFREEKNNTISAWWNNDLDKLRHENSELEEIIQESLIELNSFADLLKARDEECNLYSTYNLSDVFDLFTPKSL